jgi:hypothetical protein
MSPSVPASKESGKRKGIVCTDWKQIRLAPLIELSGRVGLATGVEMVEMALQDAMGKTNGVLSHQLS